MKHIMEKKKEISCRIKFEMKVDVQRCSSYEAKQREWCGVLSFIRIVFTHFICFIVKS